MHANLAAAMEAFKPQIAANYTGMVRSTFAQMVSDLGPSLRGIYNSWKHAKTYRNWIACYVTQPNRMDPTHMLDEERLARGAAEYADEVVAAWIGKITAKLGELEAGTVHRMDGVAFQITGTRDGRKVSIDQHMIINVSSLGRPFNQFPARIYVDGKFTSEAAYKKLFAAKVAA